MYVGVGEGWGGNGVIWGWKEWWKLVIFAERRKKR